jgi:signal transduction histidine kinase
LTHRENELVETMAAGIAHEVRNPLNAMLLNVRILERELALVLPDRRERVYTILGTLAAELGALEEFVGEFLRFARPPALELERVPLQPLLADLAAFVSPQCQKAGVQLELDVTAGPASVLADGFQLKHAVLNLVLNALHATPPGGTIEVRTAGDDEHWIVRVEDGGDGMPAEVAERAFDLFFTTREGGTGLGLPIARRIAEAHGGTLTIENLPKRGAVAALEIPVPARG